MNKTWKTIAFSALLVSQTVSALPEEHETRRLMLAAEEAVANANWREAGEYLNRLQALDTEKPVDYQYFRGRVMFEAGHLSDAVKALDAYATEAGEEGEHYQDALKLITRIEAKREKQSDEAKKSAGKSKPVATIEPTNGNSVKQLQKLYLTNSPREALVQHINGLLTLNAWKGKNESRVVHANADPDLVYQVSASASGQLQLQEVRRSANAQPATEGAVDTEKAEVVTSGFAVFGINPQVDWDCMETTASCWIYDPRDGSRWIKLRANADQAEQVAQALGELIRHLQAS